MLNPCWITGQTTITRASLGSQRIMIECTEAAFLIFVLAFSASWYILIYNRFSFSSVSAASESKHINKRRPRTSAAFIHNTALNRSTIRLSWITKKTSTVQLNLNQPGKFIFLYCNVFQFEVRIFHCSLIVINICLPYHIIYKYYDF